MANGAGTLPRPEVVEEAIRSIEGDRRDRRPWLRPKLSSFRRSAAARARAWKTRVAGYRVALPGLAGVGLISAGLALRFGTWAGLIVAGVFLLRIDSRIR